MVRTRHVTRSAGVRRGCFAPLLAVIGTAAGTPALRNALSGGPSVWALVMQGLSESDTLVRKRCRQCVQDLASLQQRPDTASAESWHADRAFWAHWLALHDSLSGYALELVQPTWRAHLPGLLAVAATLVDGDDSSWSAVTLRCRPSAAAGSEQSWLSLLLHQGLKHQNPLVQRFLASCALLAATPGSGSPLLPVSWAMSDLAGALSRFEVTGAALRHLAEVCVPTCRPFPMPGPLRGCDIEPGCVSRGR